MKALKNEKGLTLVEVLAALVILGIVFVGIMTIFPQMTLFNQKTEAKLDTMNVVREEMVDITDASKWQNPLIPSATTANTALPTYLTEDRIKLELESPTLKYLYEGSYTSTKGPYNRFSKIDGVYKYEADVYLHCEVYQDASPTSPMDMCEEKEMTKLHKVHLKLYIENVNSSGNYQLSSETFSYLTYKAFIQQVAESGGG